MKNKKELLKKYHNIYGDEAPEPPEHLLPVIIEMHESGKMEETLKKHGDELTSLGNELGMHELNKDDPAWKPSKQKN